MISKQPLILLAGWICFGLGGFAAVAGSVIAPGAKLEKLTGPTSNSAKPDE